MLKYLGIALLLIGCAGAAVPPCSHEALANDMKACVLRVKLTCAKGDKECPAYKECTAKIEEWRTCK